MARGEGWLVAAVTSRRLSLAASAQPLGWRFSRRIAFGYRRRLGVRNRRGRWATRIIGLLCRQMGLGTTQKASGKKEVRTHRPLRVTGCVCVCVMRCGIANARIHANPFARRSASAVPHNTLLERTLLRFAHGPLQSSVSGARLSARAAVGHPPRRAGPGAIARRVGATVFRKRLLMANVGPRVQRLHWRGIHRPFAQGRGIP